MRKAIFLAAEAWRQHYGQLATGRNENPDAKLTFKLPSTGQTVTLEGWSTEVQQGEDGDHTVYISPDGERYNNLHYAYEATKEANCSNAEKTIAIHAMRRLLAEMKEGHSLDATESPLNSVAEAASRGNHATGYALSQLDDYGRFPI